jgi:cholesterol 7alpha-monooxygenase
MMMCSRRYFNYLWLGFPIKWFPKALSALGELVQCPDAEELLSRPDISSYLRRAIEFMQQHDQSETDIKGHNLVYLHVNYNTFRLAFWALNNLLEDPEALKALMNEIDALMVDRYDPQTNTAYFEMKDVENMKVLGQYISYLQLHLFRTTS